MTARWFAKKLMSLMPQKRGVLSRRLKPRDIVYLFGGTFGDFVQILEPLDSLSRQFPNTPIRLCAPKNYFHEFRFLLPATVSRINLAALYMRFFKPADLLLTNVIAVYRVRFELVAGLSAVNALGFCYGSEQGRRAFSRCLRMEAGYRDYIRLNQELIRLIQKEGGGIVERIHSTPYIESDTRTAALIHVAEPDKALFHLGSAGLKQTMGLKNYIRIIHGVLEVFGGQGMEVRCVAGAMDADIRELVHVAFPRLEIREYTLEALKSVVLNWRGWLVCFNSFMAHFCRFLKKPAIVLHNRQVPMGYDCSGIHRQIVLHEEEDWRLDELKRFFEMASEHR